MSDPIITVENLSKRYRIRHQQAGPRDGLRHLLNQWATAPLRAFESLVRGPVVSSPVVSGPVVPSSNGPVVSGQWSVVSGQSCEDFWALKNVSFEVKQGEVIGIIGRNGAGKSTLLKVLSRITEPTEGRVRIKGRVASLLEVGTGFHPELTGRENIFLNGAILGMSRAEIRKKFDEIVAFAEIEKFLDTPVKRYSSGMYVRLAFAVAAHLEPEILIVDEVLAVGDAEFQKKCLGKMESVSRNEGRTILFVSHNLEAVERLTRTGIVLQEGRLIFRGLAKEALGAYSGQLGAVHHWGREVAQAPRSIRGTGFAAIERVWFLSRTDSLQFGEDLAIGVRVRAVQDLPAFAFDITIFGSSNLPVGTCFSGAMHSLKEGEAGEFELSVRRHGLAPGRYHLDAAVLRDNWLGQVTLHDVVQDVLQFEVRPPANDAGVGAEWMPGWGCLNFGEAETKRLS